MITRRPSLCYGQRDLWRRISGSAGRASDFPPQNMCPPPYDQKQSVKIEAFSFQHVQLLLAGPGQIGPFSFRRMTTEVISALENWTGAVGARSFPATKRGVHSSALRSPGAHLRPLHCKRNTRLSELVRPRAHRPISAVLMSLLCIAISAALQPVEVATEYACHHAEVNPHKWYEIASGWTVERWGVLRKIFAGKGTRQLEKWENPQVF